MRHWITLGDDRYYWHRCDRADAVILHDHASNSYFVPGMHARDPKKGVRYNIYFNTFQEAANAAEDYFPWSPKHQCKCPPNKILEDEIKQALEEEA